MKSCLLELRYSCGFAIADHLFGGFCAVVGATGFIGKYFTVRNTAGSYGHQACAARVSGDFAAFFQVKFDSYQDTLYAHTFRQFYTQCIIQGTVDFMFGNSQAVFQGCELVAKKSTLLGQQNTYTAQGRFDPHQNTGLAFQDCNFVPTSDLMKSITLFPTYLGRPWKAYSQCVLLRPTLQAHINPAGWLPWNTTNFGLYTSFFAEYEGKGPGSNTRYRVRWSHQITSSTVANRYQAASFINGKSWLPSYGLPYSLANV